jgi:hypothetical protein
MNTNINAVKHVPALNNEPRHEGVRGRRLIAPYILNWTLNGGEPASRTDHSTPANPPPGPTT